MELLTDDVLACVLRRLPPRSLAVSRCVCSAWRALVDGDGMLRADLLPRSLAGLIICYHRELPRAMLLARPGVGSDDHAIPGGALQDHCNGLLLFHRRVVNPATGSRAILPDRVSTDQDHLEYEFLAFDPAVSSHYEVVMVPYVAPPRRPLAAAGAAGGDPGAIGTDSSEWPPSPWVLTIFSSATGLWEERPFVRQGEPAGAVADLPFNWGEDWRPDGHAEYWRGSLYVHCETNFVMRISLSDSTYRVIKPPRCFGDQEFVIGRSEKGIYSAFLDDKHRLWIWTLDESCDDDQIQWKLRHDSGRGIAFPGPGSGRGPWIMLSSGHGSRDHHDEAQVVDQELEWNSDDDDDEDDDGDAIQPTDDDATAQQGRECIQVVAFHPYREIVFFHISEVRVMAYHLSSSKLEDLGELLSKSLRSWHEYIRNWFPFTPCYVGELPEKFK